jgi:predicted methyltransferase
MAAIPMATKASIRPESVRRMLEPGRLLDTGRVWEVVELADGSAAKLAQLVECLWDDNMVELLPSILSADFAHLATRLPRPSGAAAR